MLSGFSVLNEDCVLTMQKMEEGSVDLVLTSPPYNMTPRKGGNADTGRYDVYCDWKSEQEYLDWTVKIFSLFDRVLKKDSIVLYNFSYSIENPCFPYRLVAELSDRTAFTLADTIVWKKPTGMPFPANLRRLSRNWEFVWVMPRKSELKTFRVHRKVSKVSEKTGQTYWQADYNFIEARSNDGATRKLNQATFSSDLVLKLLDIYCGNGYLVYDPFNGTGTTGVGCLKSNRTGLRYVGSEISKPQTDYSIERIEAAMKSVKPSAIDAF